MTDHPHGWFRSQRPLPEPHGFYSEYRSEPVALESVGCGAEWIIYGAAALAVGVIVGALVAKALR